MYPLPLQTSYKYVPEGEGRQAQDAVLPGQEGGGVREGEAEALAFAGKDATEGTLAGEGEEGPIEIGGKKEEVQVEIGREEKEQEGIEVS